MQGRPPFPSVNECFKQMFMAAERSGETKRRIESAAAVLFAERGFHGTKMRDIARRAGTNVASAHYHFGSKDELYLAVLRGQFAEIRERLEKGGATTKPAELSRMSEGRLVTLLRNRIGTMLEILLGTPPSIHGALMLREMCDPSEALPRVVDEFLAPQLADMRQLLSRLAPELARADVERTAFSIVGQILFYRTMRPALLLLEGRSQYPRGFTQALCEHVTEFSLGGIARLRARRKRARREVSHAR